jgi:hypothetical protein
MSLLVRPNHSSIISLTEDSVRNFSQTAHTINDVSATDFSSLLRGSTDCRTYPAPGDCGTGVASVKALLDCPELFG